MLKFFCIGDVDSCTGFSLAGVEGEAPEGAEEALDAFEAALCDPDVSILIITEEIAIWLQDRITDHRISGGRPMVVEIPGNLSDEFRSSSLMESIRQAIGISL